MNLNSVDTVFLLLLLFFLDLLDVTLLNSLLIQVFNELLPLHPVDERADFAAVAEEGSARQVEGTSCPGRDTKSWLL